MEIPKAAKIKNVEKTDILTRTVSTGVFTNSVFFVFCVSFNLAFFWKHYKNRGFSPKKKTKKKQISKVKNWSKLKLKIGPGMLRNIIGPVFNFRNCVVFVVFACFSKVLFFLQGEWDFQK